MPQEKPVGAFQVVVQPVITIFQAPPGKAEVYDLQAAAAYLGITPRKLRELFAAKAGPRDPDRLSPLRLHSVRPGRVSQRLPATAEETSILIRWSPLLPQKPPR
ncbi:MAG: hypothetical protein WB696_00635 [Chthoniobacterales bacterium]